MNPDKIRLDTEAKNSVLKLCAKIRSKANGNHLAEEIASNVADRTQEYGCLSPKEITWLANNARMRNIKVPSEVEELVDELERKEKSNSDLGLFDNTVERKIYKCLRRIEKLLIKRLPA